MILFVGGLVLAIAGALLATSRDSVNRACGWVMVIGGAAMLFFSGADRWASGALVILALGFAYFMQMRPMELPPEDDVVE